MHDIRMTPIDTLLGEIFDIDPSFTIVYDDNAKKTRGICLHNAIFEANSLSDVIVKVWMYYYKEKTDHAGK